MKPKRRGPFTTTLDRIPGKGGWTYVTVPKRLTPPDPASEDAYSAASVLTGSTRAAWRAGR